jgi:transposase InsO family protein
MDYGTQYLSDYFQNQLKQWGINPSFAFIEQTHTNGLAERFIRTVKEEVISRRVLQNLQEVREAARRFVELQPRLAGGEKRLQYSLADQDPVAPPSLPRSSGLIKTWAKKPDVVH